MFYEFIFEEDPAPATHCADPVLSGASGGRCGSNCRSSGNAHHSCGTNIMYCECPKNKDTDKAGRRIRHYFPEPKTVALICPSCRANCDA